MVLGGGEGLFEGSLTALEEAPGEDNDGALSGDVECEAHECAMSDIDVARGRVG